MSNGIYRIARTADHPERWTLLFPDGSVSNRFARDESRTDVALILANAGMTLGDDNTVTIRRTWVVDYFDSDDRALDCHPDFFASRAEADVAAVEFMMEIPDAVRWELRDD